MRYAVLSDVHSNLEALTSIFHDLRKKGIRRVFFIGDAVGYGPDPEECLRNLREECELILAGNHDFGVCGLTDIEFFNPYARAAIEWTAQALSSSSLEFVRGLGVTAEIKEINGVFVHATPRDPLQWSYLLSPEDAEKNFGYFSAGICFVGHTHRPMIFEKEQSGQISVSGDSLPFRTGCRYIVNTGSVGQPRDGDSRASYVIVSEESIEIVRIPYDIPRTQEKMTLAGLPEILIRRLSTGR